MTPTIPRPRTSEWLAAAHALAERLGVPFPTLLEAMRAEGVMIAPEPEPIRRAAGIYGDLA